MGANYGKTWRHAGCMIRRRGDKFQVEIFLHNGPGGRKRETRPTPEEAEALAVKWQAEHKEHGASALDITMQDRLDLLDLRQLVPQGVDRADLRTALALLRGNTAGVSLEKTQPTPLAEAARFWLWHHPSGQTPAKLQDALDLYLQKKATRRPATLSELKHKIGRFVTSHPSATVADVSGAMVDAWLTKTLDTVPTRRKYLRVLHGFFKFCMSQYRVDRNPAKDVYLDAGELDQGEVEAYTVEEAARIMAAAAKHEQAARIVPALAIGFFAGLRPSEVQGLTWENVSMEQMQIRVTPATAKRRRQRYVEIKPNLLAWLRPYAKAAGPVSPAKITCRRDRAEVLKSAEVDRWLHDGLRHSFGTYHLAAFNDANATALQMGHRGNTDLVFQHYRKLVTQAEALKFWEIKPEAGQ